MFYHYGCKKLRAVKCDICGKSFKTDHPTKKTCSVECSSIQQQKTFKEATKDTARYNKKNRR